MNDEDWDILPPMARTEILTRGQEAMGDHIYRLPKEAFYEFAQRAVDKLYHPNASIETGAKEYEKIIQLSEQPQP